jgi:hypothetical protein
MGVVRSEMGEQQSQMPQVRAPGERQPESPQEALTGYTRPPGLRAEVTGTLYVARPRVCNAVPCETDRHWS